MPLTVYIPAVTIANVASNFMIIRWMTDTMELNNNEVLLLCVSVFQEKSQAHTSSSAALGSQIFRGEKSSR
jgi:hypothetical protein